MIKGAAEAEEAGFEPAPPFSLSPTSMSAAPRPVLLGIRDAAVEEGSRCSWDTSKAGGRADGVPGVTLECPHCHVCTDFLAHLVQVYCPLEGSSYHRTLNVWACLQPGCWGRSESWKVLRSQCEETVCRQRAAETKPAAVPTDWCEGADDWGTEDLAAVGSLCPGTSGTPSLEPDAETDTDADEQTGRLQRLSLRDEEGTVRPAALVPGFQPFYIAVLEENLVEQPPLTHEEELLHEYQGREGVIPGQTPAAGGGDGAVAEAYEKGEVRHGDTVFVKFMKQIASCPEQILRYSWSGQPLLISPLPVGKDWDIPTCENCGGRRVFEFQLMPALVSLLRSTDNKEVSVEFGTVLVFTCERSCWSPGNQRPMEEYAVVQGDPDAAFFS
ncbi:LOW QUALITY PROTEIN: programmed cell death protein 2-like [Mobula birostris]|uniref:LOW QUALITY PROTEIN: programmed cell death protein 2-like n=1 Tax=Mobula birostris TaxID=1983395 RepID=UPI003B27F2B0